jgi:cytochrome c peroxidase
LNYPNYFPKIEYDFSNNQLSKEKIELGKILFYDPILSKNNQVSCASCHSSYNAFAHTDHKLSHGIYDQIGVRNAPSLFNLAWQKEFMWDGAINHLDMQALAPINSKTEMGETTKGLINKLQKTNYYPKLFHDAFKDSIIKTEYLLKSLSQFQLTLISANSKYDSMLNGDVEFNKKEKNGYELFKNNCNSCHAEPLFTNYGYKNNGIIEDTLLKDPGRYNITQNLKDKYLFKVPSLRNLKYSYPYMHDGRMKKLQAVIEHYSEIEIDNKFIKLNSKEKIDLIAFLLTLNDKEFILNKDHKFPSKLIEILYQ